MSYNAKRETPPRMPDAPSRQCRAHGCPLRATIFDSVTGPPHDGRCRYHDAAHRKDWPYLTHELQSRPFTREAIEPVLASIGLRWREPEPPSTGPYRCSRTGLTVSDRESFQRWWALYSTNPPQVEHANSIGSFVRVGAISTPRALDFESLEERRAIQAESDGI